MSRYGSHFRCPTCLRRGVLGVFDTKQRGGVMDRVRKCTVCGWKGKTVEEVVEVIEPGDESKREVKPRADGLTQKEMFESV